VLPWQWGDGLRKIYLPIELVRSMKSHVVKSLPEEACGMIGGKKNRGRLVFPVANRLHSPTRFEMDPLEQLVGMEKIEQLGLDMLAFYHSHPNGMNQPSQSDIRAFSYPGVKYLIWFPGKQGWQVKGYEILDAGFAELPLVFGVSLSGGTSNVA
jgi:proteasome lid subunit RPN8/RPN11